ncbi:hypothetical protein [Hydrogenophaga sp. PBL-H3]|uniref:hypothetical protein n=1 Tax=Hydrogenophaga sp. PBL-H3 TaxID=434010 RepID=UPI00131F691C|nr:hypothetical protein [Hydrogenophaga sp. PBL-H3]QHE75896.1 hypothetical protein F9Z45_07405 [Hydrogenophaga sp. PBL-H3]QHE80321.1 hypothetical protein F9Z44_07405 [Hydrogenophaga sp. PBL-H3]
MELSRFHRIINQIAVDYKKGNVDSHLVTLTSLLASLAANPGNPQVGQSFKDHLEIVRQTLTQSDLNEAEGELAETLLSHDLAGYVGSELFQKIMNLLGQNQLTPNLAAPEIEKLRLEIAKKFNAVSAIDNAFTELQVEYWELDDGQTEMVIRLPIKEETKTLGDLAKESKDWNQICRDVTETFDEGQNRVTIRSVASGSILLYLAATAAFIFGMAKCLKGVNQILAEVITMKALYAKLVDSKVPDSILNDFEAHNSGKAKTDLEKLASSLVDEYYQGTDEGRRHELKNSLSISLTRLSQKLATGASVNLRLSKPKKPIIVDGEEPTPEQSTTLKQIEYFEQVQIEVDSSKTALDYREHANELVAALPPPLTEESEKPA